MPLFGAVQLMRKAVWKVLRGMAAPWDILLPPLCADDRDDFCDHLLQFLWLQDPSTVQNDVGVGGKKTIRTNVAVVGQPAAGKIRAV